MSPIDTEGSARDPDHTTCEGYAGAVASWLQSCRFGSLQSEGAMAAIPLFFEQDEGPDYLSLKTALEMRCLVVSEVSESGSVPHLQVENQGNVPVLLLDGEELAGAKQNRVLNTSILVPEKTRMEVPVSCTEHGRWSYKSRDFSDSGVVMAAKVRGKKMASVSESLRRCDEFSSNQGEVWEEIDALGAKTGTHSHTMAMKDLFEARMADLSRYEKAFPLLPHQRGLLVFINGEIAGLDMLSREIPYGVVHGKLVMSYAMEALAEQPADLVPTEEKATRFMKDLLACGCESFPSPGYGEALRFSGKDAIGSALVWGDVPVHICAFPGADGDNSTPGRIYHERMAGSRDRRTYAGRPRPDADRGEWRL